MNQFRTFFLALLILTCTFPAYLKAGLGRPLNLSEIKALKKNIKKDSNNIRARLFLSHHFYDEKNWYEVVQALGPIAEKLDDDDLYKLSQSYLNLGRPRDSEALVNILLSDEKTKSRDFILATQIYSEIIDSYDTELMRQPVIQKLFSTLKRGQSEHPKAVEIYDNWIAMAEAYIPHYANEGLRVFEDMKKNNIKLTAKHYSLQCKLNYLGNFPKGTEVFCEEAIKKDPENPSNYIYLGQNQVKTGEEKKGKRMLASVGKKFSSSEEALWAAADSYYQSKDISTAYMYFKKASVHKDAQSRDFLGLAKSAFELNKYGEALNAFVKHCELSEYLDQEFRRASGLLKNDPKWQLKYRQKMIDCKPTSYDK